MAKLLVKILGEYSVEHFLEADEISIGRRKENMIAIAEGSVSGLHARITRSGGRFVFEDLGSTNGSYLNGKQVKSTPLDTNDVLVLGTVECVFIGDPVQRPASLPKPPRPLPAMPKHPAPIGA